MNLTHQIEHMNEDYLRTVVRAALQDLGHAREAFGVDSQDYAGQVQRSMEFIRGNLEAVLTAAQTDLDRRAHGGHLRTTETD